MKTRWLKTIGSGVILGGALAAIAANWINGRTTEQAADLSVEGYVIAAPLPITLELPAGDGLSIAAAIRQLPEAGGTIQLGRAVFPVNQPIVIDRDHVELRGFGSETVLRLADAANCPVLVIGSTATPTTSIVRGVSVSGLTVDGNRDGQAYECWGGASSENDSTSIRNNGITIRGAEDVRVEHVITRHARSGGVVLEKNCRRIFITGLESHGNFFDGLAAYETEHSTFTRMRLHHNDSAALSFDWRFHRNLIADSTLEHNGSQGVFMRDSAENHFRGLKVRANGAQGIFIAETPEVAGSACLNNFFTALAVSENRGHGLRINDASCTGNKVSSSTFAGNLAGDISLQGEELLAVSEAAATTAVP